MADNNVDDQIGKELTKTIDALERERDGLSNEIAGRKTEIDKLMEEIDALREDKLKMREKIEGLGREFKRSELAKNAAEAVAARKSDLEGEVSRIKRNSLSAKSAAEGSRIECAKLRSVLEEKGTVMLDLEWEVEGLKQAKLEIEKKAKDLERKIGALEMKEIEGKSKKNRVWEELREVIEKKEEEIRWFRHKLEELQSVATQRRPELKQKLNLEEALRESEERARIMESKILKLQKKVKEAENVMRSLKEKADEAVYDEAVNGMDSEVKDLNGLKLQWPVVAASTGAMVAAAVVIYVWCGKRT